jgi:ubiquinone/menaquinone biosynthesis C-methylase UbiE
MRLFSWLMAQSYDWTMRKTEQRCLNQWREDLLRQATGDLLEIGAGTGSNLPHYPTSLSTITLSEPDPQMRRKLQQKLAAKNNREITVVNWNAEQINLPAQSLDTIVSSLVLCSVGNQQQTLTELHRVLRPGGQLLFLEHIIAAETKTVRWQKRIEPVWRLCSGNCHLTRDTANNIEAAGLKIEQLNEANIIDAPAILQRTVRGRARKPAI